jgi:hypothetical protein
MAKRNTYTYVTNPKTAAKKGLAPTVRITKAKPKWA